MLVGLFGYMLCSSGEEGGCEWRVGCASPIHHESRPSHPNIHQTPITATCGRVGEGGERSPKGEDGKEKEKGVLPLEEGGE